MATTAATSANAASGFQLLTNPSNPSEAEVSAALKLVRAGGITYPQTATPDRTATVASTTRSAARDVKLAIYDPAGLDASTRRTVVLSWHGSGYVVPRFGADADVNRWLSDELRVTVVDGDYVKAPEFRFPEALYDVVAAVRWVVGQTWFDGNLVVKGHSAGAQFALACASRTTALAIGLTEDEYSKIKACVTLYPPTDASIPLIEKPTNEQGELPGIPMSPLSYQLMHFFFGALLGWDEETQKKVGGDPRVSPAQADVASYEVPCYIIACEHDPLGPEAVAFGNKLHQHNSKHELYFAKGVGHSFETRIPDPRAHDILTHPGGKAKAESFANMLSFISKHVPSLS